MSELLLEAVGLTKRFPGVIANDDVSVRLAEGEIVGLLGENGAGKSTLVKMLFGLYSPDEGTIRVRGEEVTLDDPGDAIRLGIGMVHQHFQLVPPLTVAENIILGAEPVLDVLGTTSRAQRRIAALVEQHGLDADGLGRLVEDLRATVQRRGSFDPDDAAMRLRRLADASGVTLDDDVSEIVAALPLSVQRRGFIDERAAEERVREISRRYGLEVDPTALVEDLPVGVQQRVEILKALYRKAEILILDEPTAVLTPQETDELLQVMRDLAASGVGIIFITHKLREVLAVTDRVTVMRLGKVVADVPTEGATRESLAEAMVGRSVVLRVSKEPAVPGDVVLDVRGLKVMDSRGQVAVEDVDLEVRAGEIVGIAGVEGNGQRELVEALSGIRPSVGGTFTVNGRDATTSGPRVIHNMGVSHIPEDREKDGFVGAYSIADNLVLTSYFEKPFAERGVRDWGEVTRRARDLVTRFDVRAPGIGTRVKSLSGGNKQKVIVARELSDPDNKLVIASQPTRGVDVGSIEFIHNQLIATRDSGVAVLLVSAELDEIFGLADQIAVMYEGRIVATLDAATATREQVGLLMAGGGDHDSSG